jgi:hypothetical protein
MKTLPLSPKSARPDVRQVAGMLGIQLPSKDGQKFRSPLRPDNNPSCWVHEGRIYDGSTGEKFDGIALFAAIKKISNSEAFKELCGTCRQLPRLPAKQPQAEPKPLTWPEPFKPTRADLQAVADSRGLRIESIEFAANFARTLTFGVVCGERSWILSDARRIGWEARRIDGQKFPPIGNLSERKSHARGAGLKSWPLGILPPGVPQSLFQKSNPRILLAEGGPDYLAACQLVIRHRDWNVLPCAMLGKGADIATDALQFFHGRRVSIAGHPDATDRVASWGAQIKAAGAVEVHPVVFETGDLNDLLREAAENEREIFNLLKL